MLLGFTIILSFINNIKLYGLTNFPQEFYKEAAMKFHADLIETYGRHVYCAIALFVLVGAVSLWSYLYKEKVLRVAYTPYGITFILFVVLLTFFATLRIDFLPASLGKIGEFRKVFLFMVSVPLSSLILLFLGLKFKEFAKRPFRVYYFMVASFIAIFISIPISYGDYLFDMYVFPITGFDHADTTKIESLSSLKSDIGNQGKSTLFFLLGHSTDREILFDVKPSDPPAKMILVDKNLIKFIKISRDNIMSLRDIMKEKNANIPVPATGVSVEPLPREIQDLIQKEAGK